MKLRSACEQHIESLKYPRNGAHHATLVSRNHQIENHVTTNAIEGKILIA